MVGMDERTQERKVVFVTVEKRSKPTLTNIINQYVKKGSIIYTDKWWKYNDLVNNGYENFTINHHIEYVIQNTTIHINTTVELGVGLNV